MFDGGVERAEKIRVVFFMDRGDDIVGVAVRGPFFGDILELTLFFSGNEHARGRLEEAFEQGVMGKVLVGDNDIEVRRLTQRDGTHDILRGMDAPDRAAQVS